MNPYEADSESMEPDSRDEWKVCCCGYKPPRSPAPNNDGVIWLCPHCKGELL